MDGNGSDYNAAVFYKKILDSIEGNVIATDANGKIIYVNKHSVDRVNYTEEELLKMTIYDAENVGLLVNSATKEALKTKKQAATYITGKMRSPTIGIANPIFDENGQLEMVVSLSLHEDTFSVIYDRLAKEKIQIQELSQYLNKYNSTGTMLIAESPQMKQTLGFLSRAARTDSTIMLFGESGTGKEVLARYIHNISSRKDNLLLSINCAAMPDNLVESEFFGYQYGAFSGADRKGKMGIFELAGQGTLFLDEIGELSLGVQSKLLRVLETGEFMRLGAMKYTKADPRIICATNRNLLDMVEKKTFREDLYYRLNVISATIPPIRDRREDIEPMANYFLSFFNKKYGVNKVFSKQCVSMFLKYHWPGNAREIRNVVERMIIICPENIDILEADPSIIDIRTPSASTVQVDSPQPDSFDKSLKDALAEFERNYILQVYKECGGNVMKTAQKLQIDRSGLYKKLK